MLVTKKKNNFGGSNMSAMDKTNVIGRTGSWEMLLTICESFQVVYRGVVDGHLAYSQSYTDNWCVLYEI